VSIGISTPAYSRIGPVWNDSQLRVMTSKWNLKICLGLLVLY